MAQEPGEFHQTLIAAAGDDPALFAELRACFMDSLADQISLLGRARCDGNWEVAAMRLRSLGASFHVPQLVKLAELALESAPGDPSIVRKLERYRAEFAEAIGE